MIHMAKILNFSMCGGKSGDYLRFTTMDRRFILRVGQPFPYHYKDLAGLLIPDRVFFRRIYPRGFSSTPPPEPPESPEPEPEPPPVVMPLATL